MRQVLVTAHRREDGGGEEERGAGRTRQEEQCDRPGAPLPGGRHRRAQAAEGAPPLASASSTPSRAHRVCRPVSAPTTLPHLQLLSWDRLFAALMMSVLDTTGLRYVEWILQGPSEADSSRPCCPGSSAASQRQGWQAGKGTRGHRNQCACYWEESLFCKAEGCWHMCFLIAGKK